MRRHAGGEDGQVVSPLEHADDPALRVCLGHLDDFPGDRLEIFGLQSRSPTGSSAWASNPALTRTSSGLMRSARECRPARNAAWYSDRRVPWAKGMFRVWPSPAPVPVSPFAPVPG